MRHLKQSRFNEKRLNRGTRLGSHLHLRIRTPSIHPTDDGRDSIQSDDLALMCLRSRCKCRFFLFDYLVACHLMSCGEHNTSFTSVIDCFDCENWHWQPINLRLSISPIMCPFHLFLPSLSFDANEIEQTADTEQRASEYSQNTGLRWSFKTFSRIEKEVSNKSKWKLMDFVAKTCIHKFKTIHTVPNTCRASERVRKCAFVHR